MALNDSMYTDYLNHMSGTLGTSLIGQALKQKSDYAQLESLLEEPELDFSPEVGTEEDTTPDIETDTEPGSYDIMDEIKEGGLLGMVNPALGLYSKKWLGDIAQKGGTKLATHVAPKTIAKLGAKLGSRAIPGLGWILLGLDAVDYLLPEGYSPYDALGVSDYMSWGNAWE